MKKIMLVLVAFVLVAFPATAYANTRTGDGGDMPFYARIERDGILHTDEWAVIVFYRPPGCVPADFNLLDIMDFNAFSCAPPTTDGLIIWSGEAWVSTPIQIKLHGLGAVPVWFVDWQELQYAIADDNLTMTELEGMSSLIKGSAASYTETLHPTGEVRVPMINYVARGTLENGHSFFVHALVVVDKVVKVQIKFQ
jgi:predicted small secreted protein